MSKKTIKQKSKQKRLQIPTKTFNSASQDVALPKPESVHVSFNSLSLHGENLNELQIVAMLPPSLQEQALAMANDERQFRHEMARLNAKNEHEAKMDAQNKNFQLHRQRERSLFLHGLVGQVIALVVVAATLYAVWFYLRTTPSLPETMWKYVFSAVGVVVVAVLGRKYFFPSKR